MVTCSPLRRGAGEGGVTFTFKEARADEGDEISSPHPEYHGTVDRGTHRLERDEWKGAGGTVDMHGNLSRLNLESGSGESKPESFCSLFKCLA